MSAGSGTGTGVAAGTGLARGAAVVGLLAVGTAGIRGLAGASRPGHAPLAGHGTALSTVITVLMAVSAVVVVAVIALLTPHLRRRSSEEPTVRVHPPAPGRWALVLLALGSLVTVAGVIWLVVAAAHHGVPTAGPRAPAASPPTPAGGGPPAAASSTPQDGAGPSAGALASAAVLLAAVMGVALAAILAGRRCRGPSRSPTRGPVPPGDGRAGAADLARAAAAAATAMSTSPGDDPRSAVIACYTAMEDSLCPTAAAPRAADTPEQVLHRAAAAGVLSGPAAARLTGLFAEARYSTHPFGAAHRAAAATALHAVRDELRELS